MSRALRPPWPAAIARACAALVLLATPAAAQELDRTGTVTMVWVDARSGPPQPPLYTMVTDAGERWQLLGVTSSMLRFRPGESWARAQVSGTVVRAAPLPGRTRPVTGAIRVRALQVQAHARLQATALRLGVERYVTLRCLLPGHSPNDMPSLDALQRWLGPVFPGVPHLLTEMSRAQYTIDASQVLGPYQLPGTIWTYLKPDSSTADIHAIEAACLVLADPDVDFSQVAGVNFQFNRNELYAWGGSTYVTQDGAARVMGATWMPSWSDAGVYAHEMGHSIGWPHSGANPGRPYDSCWDVMSNPRCGYSQGTAISTHTIALNRRNAGWIAPGRSVRIAAGEERVIRIAASGAPMATDAVEVVDLPRGAAAPVTIEARRREGDHEGYIPASGIVMHEAQGGFQGFVLDVDGNGNLNDAAAVWTVGETYDDSTNGASVEVLASYQDGSYDVRAVAGWRMQVDVEGPGAVTVDGSACGSTCSRVAPTFGTRYSLAAEPAAGKVLGRWEGSCSGAAACEVEMRGVRRVRAIFGTPIVITSLAERPYGVAGAAFRDDLAYSGGDGTPQWRVTSGQLPAGLTLSAAGAIRGTPVRAGRSSVEVEVASVASTRRTFTFDVFNPVSVTGLPARVTLYTGRVAEITPTGAGGGGPLAWAIVQGELPRGLALHPGTGAISGTPDAVSRDEVVVETRWDTLRARATLVLDVIRFGITSDSLRPSVTMGAALHDTLRAADPTARWALVSGALPEGVVLDTAGVIAGVPAATGVFSFTVRAVAAADSAVRGFMLTITRPSLGTQEVANQLLGGAPLPPDASRYLDLAGNRNGRVDLADVRAWLVDTGKLPRSSSVADAARALDTSSREPRP